MSSDNNQQRGRLADAKDEQMLRLHVLSNVHPIRPAVVKRLPTIEDPKSIQDQEQWSNSKQSQHLLGQRVVHRGWHFIQPRHLYPLAKSLVGNSERCQRPQHRHAHSVEHRCISYIEHVCVFELDHELRAGVHRLIVLHRRLLRFVDVQSVAGVDDYFHEESHDIEGQIDGWHDALNGRGQADLEADVEVPVGHVIVIGTVEYLCEPFGMVL